ncbi:helix-turn-helix transcriptional regulator [Clostridium felsineum]|uniref:winged helix-turn-helix transcriptional regulator n=1 Tax=Clostridium felsineum TaxID=36839 RepID=UPI00098C080E|nr:helix-turn-helix domain-containing protein [Clostridium felsineum]MCR3758325.1 helix-turn-helix transcriptional regulator [Clostridium felsineum]URZ14970.1 HTH-type transcriptional activator HxlR [Clostridium felsineum DSM 794]
MIKYNNIEYNCSMELTMEIIGGKWKTLILWYLGKETLRFGQLKKKLPKITHKMLTQQLRALEETGLIHRSVYPSVPPKVEYSLTNSGQSLLPVLKGLCTWALNYVENNPKI